MNLSQKWPLQTSGLIALILGAFSFFVYISYKQNRQDVFFELLMERSLLRADLLKDSNRSKHFDHFPNDLHDERYAIYTTTGSAYFRLKNEVQQLDKSLLTKILEKPNDFQFRKEGEYESVFRVINFNDANIKYIIYESALDKKGITKLEFLRNVLIIGWILSALLSYFLLRWHITRGLKPIYSMAEKMNRINTEHLTGELTEGDRKDEIGFSARAFNDVLERLRGSMEQQKSFVSYVSHELRNPISIIQGLAEVTLLRPRFTAEYEATITDIKEEASRMSKLVNDLLLLANTASQSTDIELRPGRVDEALWAARKQILKKNESNEINIQFDSDFEAFDSLELQKMNADILQIAFQNLMDNACKYSDNNMCQVLIKEQNEVLEVHIIDRGKGISEVDLTSIFKPFYRSSHTRTISGHGLGLPLTKQILELHQIEIGVKSDLGSGTTFILKFPKP
jgi:signal transduction histidine kinase